MNAVICVDFGSTFTKASLVDTATGGILAAASHPTTIGTDVLDGFDAVRARLAEVDPRARDAEVLACSSAGGGLRIAVVGNEALVTAEAGRRVALSSGGKVVAVAAASAGDDVAGTVHEAQPDVVLLTGGTDGGNAEVLLDCARALAHGPWAGPVVVAGNVDAHGEVTRILGERPHVLADNVVPRIGVLAPDSARLAIREMFLAHVIGGKELSSRGDFTAMVRGATPDVVLTGVELLARGSAEGPGVGDVVVVDVGGATTDVHSAVEVDPEDGLTEDGLAREVVATTPLTRTVEGDLGMRWSAVTTVAEGRAAGILDDGPAGRFAEGVLEEGVLAEGQLEDAAARRVAEPGLLPADAREAAYDEAIATAAVGVALRRHAGRSRVVLSPEGRVLERTGKDLREVDLLVGSGGVLRNSPPGAAERVLGGVVGEVDGGWQLPREPAVVVDHGHVLAVAGLLAAEHAVAARLVLRHLHEPVA